MASTKKKKSDGAKAKPMRQPDSVASQLEALEVGDSFTRGRRLPMDDFAHDAAREWLDKTTRQLSVYIARVKEANPKHEYTMERMQAVANTSPNILCAILVTRTA